MKYLKPKENPIKNLHQSQLPRHLHISPNQSSRNETSTLVPMVTSGPRSAKITSTRAITQTYNSYSIRLFIEYTTLVRNYTKWDIMNQTDAHTVHKTQLTLTCMPPGSAHQLDTFGSKSLINYLTYWTATSLYPRSSAS